MSSAIFTPSNKVKLTNVSVVRLKRGGKRFELACYKNRVADYRAKKCRSLDDVLQIPSVFANVSKGELAKKEDIVKAFGTDDLDKVAAHILEQGEVQVSGKEWDAQAAALSKEIAGIIAEKCVNPVTNTPYPPSLIEKAMADIGFAIQPTKAAKQQALELIGALTRRKDFPIARARMRVIIDAPLSFAAEVESIAAGYCSEIEDVKRGDAHADEGMHADAIQITALVEPGNYRAIGERVGSLTHGKGAVHTISLKE